MVTGSDMGETHQTTSASVPIYLNLNTDFPTSADSLHRDAKNQHSIGTFKMCQIRYFHTSINEFGLVQSLIVTSYFHTELMLEISHVKSAYAHVMLILVVS